MPGKVLVGARCYDPRKSGRPIAEIVGGADTDLLATDDVEQILNERPDVVLYAASEFGDVSTDEEIAGLLARGVNVITPLPYHNVPISTPGSLAKLAAACDAGRSRLFATGIHPGLMFERLALTASAASLGISSFMIEEFFSAGTETQAALNGFGFGLSPAEARERTSVRQVIERYNSQYIHYGADLFGTPVRAIDYEADFRVAGQDLRLPHAAIDRGSVSFISHRFTATTQGGPRIIVSSNWYLDDEHKPAGIPCPDFYAISIEGTPSLRMAIEMRASIASGARLREGDLTTPAHYATASMMLQAIDWALAQPPGILSVQPPANGFWRPPPQE
ncbi:MAG: hypothetical protein AB7E05_14810 [Sphingobium sp.]